LTNRPSTNRALWRVLIVYHIFFRFATPLTQLFMYKVLTFSILRPI